jgi:GNAT superfamily N-acetyltransferase
MIRLATIEDLPRVVEMGRRFRRETSYAEKLKENAAQMLALAERLVAGNGLLLAERSERLIGMLGFVVYPHFISGEITAGEIFWWVEPEFRGEGLRLLREAEKCARQAGATRMQMIAPNDRVAHVYRRVGYEFVESTYQKEL